MVSRYKKSGWYNESQRHSLAAKGIKTGRKINYVLKSNLNLGEHNWSFEVPTKNKLKLSLGNFTDAGWFWDGNEDDLVLFLDRVHRSEITQQFLDSMKKNNITFNDLKPLLLKSAKQDSGLYSITGDNVRWKFGEGDDPDIDGELDFHEEQGHIKESQRQELRDEFWNEYQGVNYDDFIGNYGSDIKKDIILSIDNNNSFEGFFDSMDDVRNQSEEYFVEFQNEQVMIAMDKSIKNIKGD